MANLIAGRTVVPELIQEAFTPARVAEETLRFLTDPAARPRRGTRSRLFVRSSGRPVQAAAPQTRS